MKDTATLLSFYQRIMDAETEGEVVMINLEVQDAILHGILKDERDMMILNMALQIKSHSFLIQELSLLSSSTIIIGSMEDLDPEEMQLEEFKDEEFEDFKNGNVVMMKDFKKKK